MAFRYLLANKRELSVPLPYFTNNISSGAEASLGRSYCYIKLSLFRIRKKALNMTDDWNAQGLSFEYHGSYPFLNQYVQLLYRKPEAIAGVGRGVGIL